MIDLNFATPVDQVRLNVGDPDIQWVTDNTINSALNAFNNNVFNASVAIMQAMLSMFATKADREVEGQLQIYYSKLYERYKDRLDVFKAGDATIAPSNKSFMPIIIGGVSRREKQTIRANTDNFSMYDLANWHSESLGYRSVYEILAEDYETLLNNG